jgi:hypothetical protein
MKTNLDVNNKSNIYFCQFHPLYKINMHEINKNKKVIKVTNIYQVVFFAVDPSMDIIKGLST